MGLRNSASVFESYRNRDWFSLQIAIISILKKFLVRLKSMLLFKVKKYEDKYFLNIYLILVNEQVFVIDLL